MVIPPPTARGIASVILARKSGQEQGLAMLQKSEQNKLKIKKVGLGKLGLSLNSDLQHLLVLFIGSGDKYLQTVPLMDIKGTDSVDCTVLFKIQKMDFLVSQM